MKNLYFILSILFLFSCNKPDQENNILVLGDSNGAHEKGWVFHLQEMLRPDTLINYCISGNTIGFDNLGRKKLNTLRNIDRILAEVDSSQNQIDEVFILLGTNDCKKVFEDSLHKVPGNLRKLIVTIKSYKYKTEHVPAITVIGPPPYGHDSILIPKYSGGNGRVQKLLPQFENVAISEGAGFINLYPQLKPGFDTLTVDGVHLTQEGYSKMASIIFNGLRK